MILDSRNVEITSIIGNSVLCKIVFSGNRADNEESGHDGILLNTPITCCQ